MTARTHVLPFALEPQQGHLQCWAAVAVSLRRYYGRHPVPSQHAFARAVLGENCDQVCAPSRAFVHAGLPYRERRGPLSPAALRALLAQGHPVPACMRWFVGWHLVVIHGIGARNELWVADPLHGGTIQPYGRFASAYREHYDWSHSYLWQAPGTAAPA